MRKTARRAATPGPTATAVCGPLAKAAPASPDPAPASLHAPSALVPTVGHGESAATTAPVRAATPARAPAPSGSHPDAARACAGARGAGGDADALGDGGAAFRTREYAPLAVTRAGVWEGGRVAAERTFPDDCVEDARGAAVLAFRRHPGGAR